MTTPAQYASDLALIFGGNGLTGIEQQARAAALVEVIQRDAAANSDPLFKSLQETCDSLNRQINELQAKNDELEAWKKQLLAEVSQDDQRAVALLRQYEALKAKNDEILAALSDAPTHRAQRMLEAPSPIFNAPQNYAATRDHPGELPRIV